MEDTACAVGADETALVVRVIYRAAVQICGRTLSDLEELVDRPFSAQDYVVEIADIVFFGEVLIVEEAVRRQDSGGLDEVRLEINLAVYRQRFGRVLVPLRL